MSGPLNLDSVRISATANGFVVYTGGPEEYRSSMSSMYSFESLPSLIGWLQTNLKNNGSKPYSPLDLFGGPFIRPANLPPIDRPINEN